MPAVELKQSGDLPYREAIPEGETSGTVLLAHGFPESSRMWVPLMEALDSRLSVVAWDAPGYGDSPPLTVEAPDASDYAAALNRLLAELDISRCILIGHSLGALVAARLAVVSTNRVATLGLVSPALGYGADRSGQQQYRDSNNDEADGGAHGRERARAGRSCQLPNVTITGHDPAMTLRSHQACCARLRDHCEQPVTPEAART